MTENSPPPVAPAPAATGDAFSAADSSATAALKAAERRRRMAMGFAIAAGIVALLTGLIALMKFVASERTFSEVSRAAAQQVPAATPVATVPSALPTPAPPVLAGAAAPPPTAPPPGAAVPAAPAASTSVTDASVPPAATPVAAKASKASSAKVRTTASVKKKRAPRDDTFKRCPPLGKKGAVMCRWHICNGGAGKEAACRPYLERAP